MRVSIGFPYALCLAALVGLGLTWLTVSGGMGLGTLRVGPWTAWPPVSPQDVNRYALASIARSGDLPLGAGEGLAWVATADSDGRPLDGACRYRVEPILPTARWWTLAVYGASAAGGPAQRRGFTAAEVIRTGTGSASVTVSAGPAPGNWLPAPAGAFRLILRLYDIPAPGGMALEGPETAPAITREACP